MINIVLSIDFCLWLTEVKFYDIMVRNTPPHHDLPGTLHPHNTYLYLFWGVFIRFGVYLVVLTVENLFEGETFLVSEQQNLKSILFTKMPFVCLYSLRKWTTAAVSSETKILQCSSLPRQGLPWSAGVAPNLFMATARPVSSLPVRNSRNTPLVSPSCKTQSSWSYLGFSESQRLFSK